jgi:tRNA U34 2-thiouridine synthase MnmA/TrmU
MSREEKKIRALGLCSGGLDSMLAALVLRKLGIEVHWISFETPFFSADKARHAAEMLKIPLRVKDITDIYLELLKHPPNGFGKNMNPCMDCHSLMFKLAGQIMQTDGFDFLFSGEVLGQRPMSQTRPSLRYVEKHSGYDGYILRPLCAQNLPETLPEKNGWVDRTRLLDLSGRSRKRQIELARQFGISHYPSPAGGCLLTDKGYSHRLKDLFAHQDLPTQNDLHLLKYGRHLRLNPAAKIIVGRNQSENDLILKYADMGKDAILKVISFPGPVVLIPGGAEKAIKLLAAAICAGYSKAPVDNPVSVNISAASVSEEVVILPLAPKQARSFLI